MKRKVTRLLLSCVIILTLVLAACGQAEETEPTVTTTSEKVKDSLGRMVEKPQYGGEVAHALASAATLDPRAGSTAVWFCDWMYDSLATIDWAKGDSGTGEYSYISRTVPIESYAGQLADYWDTPDLSTFIMHLREGVRWHNKPPVNGREFVADDVVYAMENAQSTEGAYFYKAGGKDNPGWIKSTALDKYTVKLEFAPDVAAVRYNVAPLLIYPREIIEQDGGFEDWESACGTGAWVIEEYVVGSTLTFKKNADYWQNDPFFPENQLPYLDTMKVLIIPDVATRLTALRTGKVARMVGLSREDAASLKATNPELQSVAVPPTAANLIWLRNDVEPFTSEKVRRALFMAIDNQAIVKDYYKDEAVLCTWPFSPLAGDMYTPFEDLPANVKELYEFHPDKAEQLLSEAGYPDGFKMELVTSGEVNADLAAIVSGYWAEIGVDLQIRVLEGGAVAAIGKNYDQSRLSVWGVSNPFSPFKLAYKEGHNYNYAWYVDPWLDEQTPKLAQTPDKGERDQLFRDLAYYVSEKAAYIELPGPYTYTFWQPWLKGYSGEYGWGNIVRDVGVYPFVWIDQEMRQ
jgi:peptide/nickel transport system substrate-binding protein